MFTTTIPFDFALDVGVAANTPAAAVAPAGGSPAMGYPTRPLGVSRPNEASSLSESLKVLPPHAAWELELAENLRHLSTLQAGWDGAGSREVSNRALFLADLRIREVLGGFDNLVAPYLVPAGDGSVQIEWHESDGELELSIDPDGKFYIWGRDHIHATEFEGAGEEALALFRRWAPRLAAGFGHEVYVPMAAQTISAISV